MTHFGEKVVDKTLIYLNTKYYLYRLECTQQMQKLIIEIGIFQTNRYEIIMSIINEIITLKVK